jgi:hypothetical protein
LLARRQRAARRPRRAIQLSSAGGQAADAISVIHPRSLLRHPGALIVTVLAASDLAYRLLLRDSLRRALGIEATVAQAFGRPPAGRSARARGPRR